MNEGFGKDFHRKGNSVKRSGPFSEPPDRPRTLKTEKLLSSPSRKSALKQHLLLSLHVLLLNDPVMVEMPSEFSTTLVLQKAELA